ncbi:MAG: nitroreductase family protein [Nitrososphaerales archaeon]
MSNPVLETIVSRRSARKLDPEKMPPKEVIERILEAGIWAPNHHMTEPWRFIVIAGEERKKLGEVMASALGPDLDKKLEAERLKPFRAPVIIALISSPKQEPNIVPHEELVAGGAALQNMLLAIHSLGLGSMVKTGKNAYSQEVRDYLNLRDGESLVGLIYLGHPVEEPPHSKRSGHASKTEWRGL